MLLSISSNDVYITRPARPIYAREAGRLDRLGTGAAEAEQPLHLVVCKNCMASPETFACKNNVL
jgi:hypothetical protein